MFSLNVEDVKEFGEHSADLVKRVTDARDQVESLSVEIDKAKQVLERLVELRNAAAEEWGNALLAASKEFQAGQNILDAASREQSES